MPNLVRAEFKAALTGRVKAEELEQKVATIVDPLDTSKFLTADGTAVDAAKVTAFVDGIAPATGTRPSGPPNHGAGSPRRQRHRLRCRRWPRAVRGAPRQQAADHLTEESPCPVSRRTP
jgi:hypothetical protein